MFIHRAVEAIHTLKHKKGAIPPNKAHTLVTSSDDGYNNKAMMARPNRPPFLNFGHLGDDGPCSAPLEAFMPAILITFTGLPSSLALASAFQRRLPQRLHLRVGYNKPHLLSDPKAAP